MSFGSHTSEVTPEVVRAMRAAIKVTGVAKLFAANITADGPAEIIARGKYVLAQFGPLSEDCAFLVRATWLPSDCRPSSRTKATPTSSSPLAAAPSATRPEAGRQLLPPSEEEAWTPWRAGVYGSVSLSDGVIEYAKTREEIKGAFFTVQMDADQIYPNGGRCSATQCVLHAGGELQLEKRGRALPS